MQRGVEIRFCGGQYHGKTGWKNVAREPTNKGRVPVIVLLDPKKPNKVKVTNVERHNVRKPWAEAKTMEEAALQQYKDLEGNMIKSAMLWAKMGTIDHNKILKMFEAELVVAQKVIRRKKTYNYVEFPYNKRGRDDEDEMDLDSWL